MSDSRGNAISAYIPGIKSGANGVQVYADNIVSDAITSAKIADGAVTSAKLGSGVIVSGLVGAVTSAYISAGGVAASNIAAAAVISAKIGVSAVHTENISGGAVVAGSIGVSAVTSAKIAAAFLSGTLVSGQTTRAISHGLGVKPKSVVVVPILTLAQAISGLVPQIHLAAASAATSTNFYVIGSQANDAALKYVAYVQL